ncbi:MAG: long-chain acyl-CoA synthetase [Kiritimatiellia bacterium]|jgi:long-chain acyl-CoA synthetase
MLPTAARPIGPVVLEFAMPLAKSLVHQLQQWAKESPDDPAIHGRIDGGWNTYSWADYWTAVREVGKGLIALGHQPTECVAIVGHNRPEWVICQMAIMAIRGVPAPSYPTNTKEQVAHILRNSESRIAIADTKALIDQYRAAKEFDPSLQVEVLIATEPGEEDSESKALEAIRALGREQDDAAFDARLDAIEDDDTCLLIYTSGTTGVSKGVKLDHGGVVALTESLLAHAPGIAYDGRQYKVVSYLPLCHIAEQVMTNFMSVFLGGQVYFCPDLKLIKECLVEVHPTVFAAVPRVWEKFQAVLESRLSEATGIKGSLASWALKTERGAIEREMESGQPSKGLARSIAQKLVVNKIKAALGLDQLKLAVTAAAPISRGTLEFFTSIGIVVHEYYGMSETTGLISGNPVGQCRFGTVGKPLKDIEVKIAEDGEILCRGRNMTRGYLRMPDKTADLIDAEGWLHTGDLGSLDSDGYLKITGRKKDILITAGGKNVAPAEMELLISQIPGVAQVVVVGDRKPYLCSLLTLDPENLEALATAAGSKATTIAGLAGDDKVTEWLQGRIEDVCNKKVARYQTIKYLRVVPSEFSVDGGELTPTMKVRRNVVNEKHGALIESMYQA